jgi:hypothetical protein
MPDEVKDILPEPELLVVVPLPEVLELELPDPEPVME